MITSAITGVGTLETLPMTTPILATTAPVIARIPDTAGVDPITATLEHIVATLARFEIRLEAQERHSVGNHAPTRPPADPPYGMPSGWTSEPVLPQYTASTAVSTSISSTQLQGGMQHPPFQFNQPEHNDGSNMNAGKIPLLPHPGFNTTGFTGSDRFFPSGSASFPYQYGGPRPNPPKPQSSWETASAFVQPRVRTGPQFSTWDQPSGR